MKLLQNIIDRGGILRKAEQKEDFMDKDIMNALKPE